MPASKIQDEQEVIGWFREGKTYAEMSRIYQEKYGIATVPSLWSNFRRRRNLPARVQHDESLIPWRVKEDHQFHYILRMLRCVARVRRGDPLRDEDVVKHRNFLNGLEARGEVVCYDPNRPEGFYLDRRTPADRDIVRGPERARVGRHAVV